MKARKVLSKCLRFWGVFTVLGLVGNSTLFAGSTPFENRALDLKFRKAIEKQGYCYTKDKVSGDRYFGEFDPVKKQYRLLSADNSVDSNLLYDDNGMPLGFEKANCSEQEELYDRYGMKPVKVGTHGVEDRNLMTEAEKQIPEYKRVGVFTANKAAKIGTGTVMGENCDYVFVSSHMERSPDNFFERYSNFGFYPNPKNLRNLKAAKLVKSGWDKRENHGKGKHDYAIFKLDQPAFSKSECQKLGKLHIKKWDPNNPERSSCEGKMSKVAMNSEDARNKRIVREFYGQEPRDFGREKETYQSDVDSNHRASGSGDWCHEGGVLKLSGIAYWSEGWNPKKYKIKVGEDPGFGPYNKNTRYTASVSMWPGLVNDLIKFVGEDSFIIE